MEPSLLDKLVTEVRRYQNNDFLKAAMAVCALTANADDEVNLAERYGIDHALETEPALRLFDPAKAVRILDDYIFALREEGDAAKAVLDNKVRRFAGDHKRSRTLMRVAYLIIAADQEIHAAERAELDRLSALLDLDPAMVWPA